LATLIWLHGLLRRSELFACADASAVDPEDMGLSLLSKQTAGPSLIALAAFNGHIDILKYIYQKTKPLAGTLEMKVTV
jgi:hypothetical protein